MTSSSMIRKTLEQEYDIVVIGGGTAGPMAAIKAKERNRDLRVLLIDKANVKSACARPATSVVCVTSRPSMR